MNGLRFVRLAGAALLLFSLAGCGEKETETTPPEPPLPEVVATIHTFAAAPEIIRAGEAVTLHWVTENVVTLELQDGAGNPISLEGADPARGSVQVFPAEDTAYTLVATGADASRGQSRRTVTVVVEPVEVACPTIDEFVVSPATVASHEEAVLSWRTTGATLLSLTDQAGQDVLEGAVPGEGQATVRPSRSTTYTLVAACPNGRETATARVEVTGLPSVVKFYVDPIAPVPAGGTVALVWETVNATQVTIRQGTTAVVETDEARGRHEVVLAESATFELVATGADGSTATATAMGQVGPVIAGFGTDERVVRAGDTILLTWEIEDADRAAIDGPGGYHYNVPAGQLAQGQVTQAVTEPGEFVLRAFRRDVEVGAKLYIEVTEAPRIRELSVDRTSVTADHYRAAPVVLSWRQDGATTCTILANNAPVEDASGFACANTGSREVQVRGSTNLRLVAANDAGEHALTVTVQAFTPAEIVAFAKHPDRRVAPGETIELSWTVAEADSVELTKNGVPLSIDPTAFVGSVTDRVDLDSVYALTARNSLGDPTVAELTATTGAPVILGAEADPAFVGIGDAFTLRWTADGGDELTVTGPTGEVVHRTTDPEEIDEGSARLLVPLAAGVYTYTIAASNAAGAGLPFEVPVTVSDGPMIQLFTVDPGAVSLGQSVTFSWIVSNDPDGQTPTLTLVDDQGNTYPQIANENPNQDTLTITLPTQGVYVFTLTATTQGRTPATAQVTLDVSVPPELVSFTASHQVVSTEGGTVVPDVILTWESRDSVELTLWERGADGNLVPPPFHRVSLALGATQEQVDAGSYTVHPTSSTTYVARARNRIGTDVFADVRVIVDPPEILDFHVSPPEIREGGTATLEWTTNNANSVRILPQPVVRSSNNFVDISAAAGAGQVTFSSSTAVATINFPTGFTYPFQGTDRSAIQVCTEGWAGFNTANTATNTVGYAFPTSTTYDEVNFAPYWDSHDHTKNATAGVYYGLASDAEGDFFVIQWKNWSFSTTADNPSDLNFEIILRPNGDFEYRYGTMTSAVPTRAAGDDVSIGYQGTTAAEPYGQLVPFPDGLPAGGLENQSFRVVVSAPLTGSQVVNPDASTTYTLIARNDDAEITAEARVILWKDPTFRVAWTEPGPPMAGEPFDIRWDADDVTRMRVLDQNGTAICDIVDPLGARSGRCRTLIPGQTITNYQLVAYNGPIHAPVASTVQTLTVIPLGYLGIDHFEVTPEFPAAAGETVTISWTARGAIEVFLYACTPGSTTCTDITPAGANPASGSTTYTINGSTEFVLAAGDMLGRTVERTAGAYLNPASLDSLTISANQIAAGQAVTVTWDTTAATMVEVTPSLLVEDATGKLPFIELVDNGGVEVPRLGTDTAGRYDFDFPDGFAFPWFGTLQTRAQVSCEGWLGFDQSNTTSNATNYTFPTSSTYVEVQIAAFWDDQDCMDPAKVLYRLDRAPSGQRYLVVELYDFEDSTDTASHYNYEIVLWENGDFDLRYGEMIATGTYVDDANGSQATIGFQNGNNSVGYTFSHDTEIPGGLSNRSFRFRPGVMSLGVDGTTTIYPAGSTTYEVCATNAGGYRDCQEVQVVVVDPGDLLFSEAMIAPTSPDAEWFEIRNVSGDPIDLALGNWAVSAGAGETFAIPGGTPMVVPPGGYRVFARSGVAAVNGGLVPDVVYGSALTLDDVEDALELTMGGIPIDRFAWDATWTIPAGQALVAEPAWLYTDPTSNDAELLWCAATAPYGDGSFTGSPGTAGDGCYPPPPVP
jgi:hypothetical protein